MSKSKAEITAAIDAILELATCKEERSRRWEPRFERGDKVRVSGDPNKTAFTITGVSADGSKQYWLALPKDWGKGLGGFWACEGKLELIDTQED